MRIKLPVLALFAGILILIPAIESHAQNSINGIVFDESRRPVANIVVELLDDLERLSESTTTNGSGLFMFNSLRAGVYYVRIRVSGTPFLEEKERLQIGSTNISRNGNVTGSESRQLNFFLRAANKPKSLPAPEVVFAQEIPAKAKDHFDAGADFLKGGNEAFAKKEFEAALQVFPDYFLAGIELGKIYFELGDFVLAEKVYKKTSEVNDKSFAAFWGLALSLEKQGSKEAAIKALVEATKINRESVEGHQRIGILLRDLNRHREALKSFLLAKQFAKNSYPEVHWNLALLYYYNLGEPGPAADELELYLKAMTNAERKTNQDKIDQVKQLIAMMRKQEK